MKNFGLICGLSRFVKKSEYVFSSSIQIRLDFLIKPSPQNRHLKATMADMVKISNFEPFEKISVNLKVTINTN